MFYTYTVIFLKNSLKEKFIIKFAKKTLQNARNLI